METCVVAVRDARSFLLVGDVIECSLVSGLSVRHSSSRAAGMVISGSAPNLHSELDGSTSPTGFAVPDQTIMRPFRSSSSRTS
jgi:hypothetical protein